MAQFHETRMGVRFFEAELPRITKALEGIAESLAKLAAAQPTKTFQPVCEKCGGNATDGYKVGALDVCESCFHELAGLVPVEDKCGANVCCDDPDCPDKDAGGDSAGG